MRSQRLNWPKKRLPPLILFDIETCTNILDLSKSRQLNPFAAGSPLLAAAKK
jgi:hypothetical protein